MKHLSPWPKFSISLAFPRLGFTFMVPGTGEHNEIRIQWQCQDLWTSSQEQKNNKRCKLFWVRKTLTPLLNPLPINRTPRRDKTCISVLRWSQKKKNIEVTPSLSHHHLGAPGVTRKNGYMIYLGRCCKGKPLQAPAWSKDQWDQV